MHRHICAENRFWLSFFFEKLWSHQESLSSSPARLTFPLKLPLRFILMPCEMEFNYFHSLPFTSKTNLFFVFFWLKDTGGTFLRHWNPILCKEWERPLSLLWCTISSEFHDPSRVSFSERSMPKDLSGGAVTRIFRENPRCWTMISVSHRRTPSKSSLLFVEERKVCSKGWEEGNYVLDSSDVEN